MALSLPKRLKAAHLESPESSRNLFLRDSSMLSHQPRQLGHISATESNLRRTSSGTLLLILMGRVMVCQ